MGFIRSEFAGKSHRYCHWETARCAHSGQCRVGSSEDDTEQPDYTPAHNLPPKDSIPLENEPGEVLPRLTLAFVKCLLDSNIINGS